MTLVDPPDQILALPSQVSNKETGTRLASALSARGLVTELVKEDRWRSYQRAVVDGCYDGNQPYNQAKLNRDGMAWATNLNFLGMEGRVDGARVPYYALFSAVGSYVNYKTKFQSDTPDAAQWDIRIAEAVTRALGRWKQFKWHMQAQQFEMLYEGWGALLREDDTDFRFRAIPARSVLVPQGSPSCMDHRIPYVAVRIAYRIHELYDKIRDAEAAQAAGWNVPLVQKAIMYGTRGAGGTGMDWRQQPWEVWQQRYKDREFEMSYTEADFISCAHIFVQECSGKVSHFIVCESMQQDDKDGADGFLFKHTNRFDSYTQVLHVGFQNTGRGQWHGVRGMGVKAFKAEETMNRLQCRAIDNAFLKSGFTLQPTDNRSQDKMQMTVTHGVNWIPPGTNFIERSGGAGELESILSVSRFIDNQVSQKLGNFQQRAIGRDDGRGEQPTATQVELSAAKETALSNGQIDNYYNFLDEVYEETFRRLRTSNDPIAKQFRDELDAAGVPKEAVEQMEYIRANRLSGYGSPQMRVMQLEASQSIVPMLPEEGKNNWLNEFISATNGPDKVSQWNPPMPKPDIDDAIIPLENAAMLQGIQPVLVSGMNDVRHLQGHLADAEQRLSPMADAMEAGETPDPAAMQEAYKYVQALGSHCEAHLSRLEADPMRKDLAEVFRGQLRALGSFNGKIFNAIRDAQRRAQQAAREQSAEMALAQAEIEKMQNDQARDDYKAQSDIARKDWKAGKAQELKTWQAAQSNRLATINTAASIENDRMKTAAEVQKKKATASLNGKKK